MPVARRHHGAAGTRSPEVERHAHIQRQNVYSAGVKLIYPRVRMATNSEIRRQAVSASTVFIKRCDDVGGRYVVREPRAAECLDWSAPMSFCMRREMQNHRR